MQGRATDYVKEILADIVLNNRSFTFPSTLYLGAFTTEILGNGTGTEVSGNGYTRIQVAFTTSGATRSNSAEVEFPTATGSWGAVSHFGLIDASTGGNILAGFAIPVGQVRQIVDGDTINVPVNALQFTAGGNFTTYSLERINDILFNNASITFPSTLYTGLYTSAITVGGVGTEITNSNYARRGASFSTSGLQRTNTNEILFATLADENTSYSVQTIGISDALTAGNILFWFPIDTVVLNPPNDQGGGFRPTTPRIFQNILTFTLADTVS